MKKPTMLTVAALAMALGASAWADDELARPNTPPDLTLLCYPKTPENTPDAVDIWLSQKALRTGSGSLYRVEVTPTQFRYVRAPNEYKWRELIEIDRVTGHLSVKFSSGVA